VGHFLQAPDPFGACHADGPQFCRGNEVGGGDRRKEIELVVRERGRKALLRLLIGDMGRRTPRSALTSPRFRWAGGSKTRGEKLSLPAAA